MACNNKRKEKKLRATRLYSMWTPSHCFFKGGDRRPWRLFILHVRNKPSNGAQSRIYSRTNVYGYKIYPIYTTHTHTQTERETQCEHDSTPHPPPRSLLPIRIGKGNITRLCVSYHRERGVYSRTTTPHHSTPNNKPSISSLLARPLVQYTAVILFSFNTHTHRHNNNVKRDVFCLPKSLGGDQHKSVNGTQCRQ